MPSSLADLPDPALSLIFSYLSRCPGVAPDPGPVSLACTCARLNRFYRQEHVNSFVLSTFVAPWVLSRQLVRFQAVTSLSINLMGRPVFLDLRAGFTCRTQPERPASITSIALSCSTVSRDGVEALVELCPNLDRLLLDCCLFISDKQLSAITDNLGGTLKHLSLNASGRMEVSDVSGSALHALSLLETLDLSHCGALSSNTFATLSSLTQLKSLRLVNTRVVDSDLSSLSALPHLTSLNLSSCESLYSACIPLLPPSLTDLNLHLTNVVDNSVPPHVLSDALPNLKRLDVSESVNLSSWTPLRSVLTTLESLLVCGSSLTEDAAFEAFAGAAHIRDLNIADMQDVGDEVARAVASCAGLRSVRMNNTGVTNEGVAAFAKGVCCKTIVLADFSWCEAIKDREKAERELRSALKDEGAVLCMEFDEV